VVKLQVCRTYYWRIDSVNSGGTTTGQTWSFTTAPGLKTLVVESMHGEPAPESGAYSYPHGTILTNAVLAPDTQSSTQYVCTGWAMSGCEPARGGGLAMTMILTNNATLVWQWGTNVWFDSGAGPHGHVEGASDGWYGVYSALSVTAEPDPYYHFAGWQGDVAPGETLANPLRATLDRPRSVTALFAEDLAPMGTPEWWMAANGLTGEGFEIEETLDRDGDGMAAWQEWIAGTCPTDRLDRLCLVECSPLADGQGVAVRWQSVAGRAYTVYRAASLAGGAWSNVYEIVGDGGLNAYTDPNGGGSRAYFRIGVRLAD